MNYDGIFEEKLTRLADIQIFHQEIIQSFERTNERMNYDGIFEEKLTRLADIQIFHYRQV
jgi:hypothetical protein